MPDKSETSTVSPATTSTNRGSVAVLPIPTAISMRHRPARRPGIVQLPVRIACIAGRTAKASSPAHTARTMPIIVLLEVRTFTLPAASSCSSTPDWVVPAARVSGAEFTPARSLAVAWMRNGRPVGNPRSSNVPSAALRRVPFPRSPMMAARPSIVGSPLLPAPGSVMLSEAPPSGAPDGSRTMPRTAVTSSSMSNWFSPATSVIGNVLGAARSRCWTCTRCTPIGAPSIL
jgi:hypothetical protein